MMRAARSLSSLLATDYCLLSTVYCFLARPEALAVLGRRDERLDHLGGDGVAVEVVQLAEPEVEAGGVRVAAQVAEVLHRDEGGVALAILKELELAPQAQRGGARQRPAVQAGEERVAEGLERLEVAADLAAAELRSEEDTSE